MLKASFSTLLWCGVRSLDNSSYLKLSGDNLPTLALGLAHVEGDPLGDLGKDFSFSRLGKLLETGTHMKEGPCVWETGELKTIQL